MSELHWTGAAVLLGLAVLGAGFTDRLQKALLAINDPKLLAALPRDRLVPARNEDYEKIREIAQQLGMLR